MASAKKTHYGAYRCRPSKMINGKKVTKSFTANPKDFGNDWKKAKNHAELLAREWLSKKRGGNVWKHNSRKSD